VLVVDDLVVVGVLDEGLAREVAEGVEVARFLLAASHAIAAVVAEIAVTISDSD
jgi:hypothetical protein